MTENIDNLILEHLRYICTDLGGIKNNLSEINQRPNSLETSVAGLKRDNASVYGDIADQHMRYDRLVERVERIERHLDLKEES